MPDAQARRVRAIDSAPMRPAMRPAIDETFHTFNVETRSAVSSSVN